MPRGHRPQLPDQPVQRGQQHLFARRLQHQRVADVVDVFAGAGEVHELGRRLEFGAVTEAALDPVLDRLDIVVGGLLDVLDRLCVGLGEAHHEAAQQPSRGLAERRQLRHAGVRQGDQPFDFDLHPAVHQAELAEQRAQGVHAPGVAAIQRRQGGQRGEGHGPGGERRDEGSSPILFGGAREAARKWRHRPKDGAPATYAMRGRMPECIVSTRCECPQSFRITCLNLRQWLELWPLFRYHLRFEFQG